jgi:hypothetical protein
MKSSRLGFYLAILVFSAGEASGQSIGLGEENRFEFEYRRWRPTLVSDWEVGNGTAIHPKEDLGVSDEDESDFRGFLRFGRWVKVRGSYVSFDFQGSKTVEKDITLADITFPEGSNVDTSLKLQHYKVGVEVDILLLREGFLAVVADWSRTEARPILTSSETEANGGVLRVQLPTLGLKGRVYLTRGLALTVEASGMRKGGSGVITDVEGVVTYSFSRNFGVSFGYRNLYTKWLDGDDRATFRLRGNFFSATVRF